MKVALFRYHTSKNSYPYFEAPGFDYIQTSKWVDVEFPEIPLDESVQEAVGRITERQQEIEKLKSADIAELAEKKTKLLELVGV